MTKQQTPIAKAIQKIRERITEIMTAEEAIQILEMLKEEEKQFRIGEHGNRELQKVMIEQFHQKYTQE